MNTLKKRASKVVHNHPKLFFSKSSPANSSGLMFHIINMFQDICLLICDIIPNLRFYFKIEPNSELYFKDFVCNFFLLACRCQIVTGRTARSAEAAAS